MSLVLQQNKRKSGLSLESRGIVKAFGSKQVLKGIDLDIRPSEFVAVVGKSGCGKSTLLRLIAGLERQNAGALSLGGKNLSGADSRVRVVFQDHRLLPWKRAVDNVAFGLGTAWKKEALAMLRNVGLAERANDWPATLSGGEKQRVSLARALLTKPGLLLFDEPLGALDALTRIGMQDLIERLWQEQQFSALLITHDVEEAVALADRVVIIKDGVIDFEVAIDLPRPRPRVGREFDRLKELILERVLDEDENSVTAKSFPSENQQARFLPSYALAEVSPYFQKSKL